MFEQILDTDFFKNTIESAKYINIDRLKYQKIFDIIRESVNDKKSETNMPIENIIFSDIDIITKNKPNKIIKTASSSNKIIKTDIKTNIIKSLKPPAVLINNIESEMIIYTPNTRKIATTIANILHKNIGKYVQMRSIIPNDEYVIMYDMRTLIRIYRIDKYKNVKLDVLFNAININNLLYFPAEVELIDIYHKLYLPNFYSMYDTLSDNEIRLYKVIKKDNKIGGDIKCKECKFKNNLDIDELKILMVKFLSTEKYVFVGNLAHSVINKDSKLNTSSNIQVISEYDIDQDYSIIVNYLARITQYGIFYKKKRLYIPKDNRLFKYTFFIKYQTFGKTLVNKPFLDIYNSGSYELIPYINIKVADLKIDIKVGSVFVQQRFLLIDLWILKLIKILGNIDLKSYETMHSYIFSNLDLVKKNMPDGFTNYPNKYIGINFDEKIDQNIEISKKQITRTSYYPELSIQNNNIYKLVATT